MAEVVASIVVLLIVGGIAYWKRQAIRDFLDQDDGF